MNNNSEMILIDLIVTINLLDIKLYNYKILI